MVFELNDASQTVTLELPRLYYLGYRVQDQDHKYYSVKESKTGFVMVTLLKNGIYTLSYDGTTLYKGAIILRNFGVVLIIVIYLIKRDYFHKLF